MKLYKAVKETNYHHSNNKYMIFSSFACTELVENCVNGLL